MHLATKWWFFAYLLYSIYELTKITRNNQILQKENYLWQKGWPLGSDKCLLSHFKTDRKGYHTEAQVVHAYQGLLVITLFGSKASHSIACDSKLS